MTRNYPKIIIAALKAMMVLGLAVSISSMAQEYQPQMTFWVSPWSPPAWMKINQDYLLSDDGGVPDPTEMQFNGGQRGSLFPKKLVNSLMEMAG